MTLIQRLDQITARLKAATPGPWMTGDCMDCPGDVYSNEPDGHCLVVDNSTVLNAELIANAPADLTFLSAALREAIEALSRLQKIHGEYLGNGGLFNPELMVLSGNELRDLLRIASETLANIQRLAGE